MRWYEERSADDAPVQYDSGEASAWAAGWNAAVQKFSTDFDSNWIAMRYPPAARTTDPITSKRSAAARRIKLPLAWGSTACQLLDTYAWHYAPITDGTAADAITIQPARWRSVARMCTDFRRLGWIEPVGMDGRAMTCQITHAGRKALAEARRQAAR